MTHDGIPKVNDLLAPSWSRRKPIYRRGAYGPPNGMGPYEAARGAGGIFKQMLQNGQIPAGVKNLGQMGSGRYQAHSGTVGSTLPPRPRGGASPWCISATSPQGARGFGGAVPGGTTVSQPPGHSPT